MPPHVKGSRVRTFLGTEGDILEVHLSPIPPGNDCGDRAADHGASYSVLWDDGTLSRVEHRDVMPWH